MTVQRSETFNAFIETLVGIYQSNETSRCICSVRMFETLFFQHTKEKMERHTRQIVRNEMKRRGYKVVIGLDVCITKLPVVEVPEKQWPLLIDTLVKRVQIKAKASPTPRMRFTLKQFQDFATIWPTTKEFEAKVVEELRKVCLVVYFQATHVIVVRETPCTP